MVQSGRKEDENLVVLAIIYNLPFDYFKRKKKKKRIGINRKEVDFIKL